MRNSYVTMLQSLVRKLSAIISTSTSATADAMHSCEIYKAFGAYFITNALRG